MAGKSSQVTSLNTGVMGHEDTSLELSFEVRPKRRQIRSADQVLIGDPMDFSCRQGHGTMGRDKGPIKLRFRGGFHALGLDEAHLDRDIGLTREFAGAFKIQRGPGYFGQSYVVHLLGLIDLMTKFGIKIYLYRQRGTLCCAFTGLEQREANGV